MPNMSCSKTIPAVKARIKLVTRRDPETWVNLAPGDHVTLIEKGMGLAKGEKQVVLDKVEIVDVRIEPLTPEYVTSDEIALEGFDPDEWTPAQWIEWFIDGKPKRLYRRGIDPLDGPPMVRRIEWKYLD